MSNKPIKMNRLRQIIRLYCQGTGIKTIHGMVGISRNTIKKYVRVWHSLGMTHEEFGARSDSELAALFTTPESKVTNNICFFDGCNLSLQKLSFYHKGSALHVCLSRVYKPRIRGALDRHTPRTVG